MPSLSWSHVRFRLRRLVLETGRRVRTRTRLRDVRDRDPVLVFQMGKVGSSTVTEALRSLELDRPVVHVHTLDRDEVEAAVVRDRAVSGGPLPEHLLVSSHLIEALDEGLFPCTVVTLTREPIGRAVSMAFENWQQRSRHARDPRGVLDPALMRQAVVELLAGSHGDPSRWFDRELQAVFGLDVFSVPYDYAQGFTVLEHPPVTLLVIRMEDLDRALPNALAAVLDVTPDEVVPRRANEGLTSWYGESLRTVKETLRLPEPLMDRILGTRYVEHFYADRRDALRRRWQA